MPTPELIVFAWILSECQALIRIPRKFIDLAAKHINVKVLDPRVGDCLSWDWTWGSLSVCPDLAHPLHPVKTIQSRASDLNYWYIKRRFTNAMVTGWLIWDCSQWQHVWWGMAASDNLLLYGRKHNILVPHTTVGGHFLSHWQGTQGSVWIETRFCLVRNQVLSG